MPLIIANTAHLGNMGGSLTDHTETTDLKLESVVHTR
jgi:hypothetical protein